MTLRRFLVPTVWAASQKDLGAQGGIFGGKMSKGKSPVPSPPPQLTKQTRCLGHYLLPTSGFTGLSKGKAKTPTPEPHVVM